MVRGFLPVDPWTWKGISLNLLMVYLSVCEHDASVVYNRVNVNIVHCCVTPKLYFTSLAYEIVQPYYVSSFVFDIRRNFPSSHTLEGKFRVK